MEEKYENNETHIKGKTLVCFVIFVCFILILIPAAGAQEGGAARLDEGARAGIACEMITKARLAIGGEDALAGINSLSTSAKLRRYVKYVGVQSPRKVIEKEQVLPGKLEVDFLLPGKYRKRIKSRTLRGMGYSYSEVVNGERAWRNPSLRAISSHRDNRVIDVDDFDRTVELQAQGARQQLTLYSLAWLLKPLPSFPLEFSYMGRFQTRSGEADVISARGPENFHVFLLLDPYSHRPLALALTYVEARQEIVLVEIPGFFDRRFTYETFQRARQERANRRKPPQRYEMHMQLSDYRQIAGVLWPHTIKTVINGELIEEMAFDDFEINRHLNPGKFEGQPKPKF